MFDMLGHQLAITSLYSFIAIIFILGFLLIIFRSKQIQVIVASASLNIIAIIYMLYFAPTFYGDLLVSAIAVWFPLNILLFVVFTNLKNRSKRSNL